MCIHIYIYIYILVLDPRRGRAVRERRRDNGSGKEEAGAGAAFPGLGEEAGGESPINVCEPLKRPLHNVTRGPSSFLYQH